MKTFLRQGTFVGWVLLASPALFSCSNGTPPADGGNDTNGDGSNGSGAPAPGDGSGGATGPGGSASATDPGGTTMPGYRMPGTSQGTAPTVTPTGHLLLTAERLAVIQAKIAAGAPEWQTFMDRVNRHATDHDAYASSPENTALAYLLTKDAALAQHAYDWAKAIVDAADVRFDSYLRFGDRMREVALVLDYCGDALDASQKQALADYLDKWTNELWFANAGSGWGLDDPGNNYHHAFLEGTAYAGYALKQAGSPNGQKYLDLLTDKLTKTGGVFDYLRARLAGGDWLEGANYGERSKERLFSALSAIASMGGPNYVYQEPYFAQSVYFALYQLTPDRTALAPIGDLARDSAMPTTPADRDLMLTMAYWLGDGEAKHLAAWYVANATPGFVDGTGMGQLAFKEVLFGWDQPQQAPDQLPLGYVAPGTGFVNWRSGWDTGATSLTLSAAATIDQVHQHHDVGSFTLFQHGWLAMDASTLSSQGLEWSPGAHNIIDVPGAERVMTKTGGLRRIEDQGAIAYAQIDATGMYQTHPSGDVVNPMMKEVTRELVYLRPGTVVTYDRVEALNGGQAYDWRLHVPAQPSGSDARWQAAGNGGGLTLVPLQSGPTSAASDGDLENGGSNAWRVSEAPTGPASRYLNAIAVAAGGAPDLVATRLTSDGAAEGVVTGGVAMMFSRNAFGASALPFTYTVPAGTHTHVLADIDQPVDVEVSGSTVTVRAGSQYTPSKAGLVVLHP